MPEDNDYIKELIKCVGKEVKVYMTKEDYINGQAIVGVCKSINFQYLNIVLMQDTEKLIIKNPQIIARARDYKG